jgi:two-component system chemotaxis response regulator CheB
VGLPADFPVPILVVQHIAKGFADGLAAWLNTVSPIEVKVAAQGAPLEPHTVYLAPDDRHLGVSPAGALTLSDASPIGGFRPSGSHLFETVARVYGPGAVALILTGMGQDGVEGLKALREAGGLVIAQDEESSVVFGMPAAAIDAGLAHEVLSLDEIASRLRGLVTKVASEP